LLRWPRRGASFSIPAMPRCAKRRRHKQTVLEPQRSSCAIWSLRDPEAAKSAILDRNTNRAGVERPRAQRSSTTRSLSDSLIAGAVLIENVLREARIRNCFRVVVLESLDAGLSRLYCRRLCLNDKSLRRFSCSAARGADYGKFDELLAEPLSQRDRPELRFDRQSCVGRREDPLDLGQSATRAAPNRTALNDPKPIRGRPRWRVIVECRWLPTGQMWPDGDSLSRRQQTVGAKARSGVLDGRRLPPVGFATVCCCVQEETGDSPAWLGRARTRRQSNANASRASDGVRQLSR
jgi:hypothetical protein